MDRAPQWLVGGGVANRASIDTGLGKKNPKWQIILLYNKFEIDNPIDTVHLKLITL